MRRYYGIENLNLNAAQRQTLVDALRQLGANNQAPNPCNRNHWRARLDNQAVIFEADWNSEDWTIDAMKARLGQIFSVNPAIIDHALAQTTYGPLVTFGAGGTDYLRMIVFGGVSSTYAESHDAVLDYLSANREDWETEL